MIEGRTQDNRKEVSTNKTLPSLFRVRTRNSKFIEKRDLFSFSLFSLSFLKKKSPGRLFPDRRTSAFTIVFYGIARAGPHGSYDKYLFNEGEPQQEL